VIVTDPITVPAPLPLVTPAPAVAEDSLVTPAPGLVAAASAAPLPDAPLPAAVPAAGGGRQTAIAAVMAALVLIGLVVTLMARDTGSTPAARGDRAATVAAGAGGDTGSLPPLTLTQPVAPLLVAESAGGRAPLAPPHRVRHARSGTRIFPHRSIPVRRHRPAAAPRAGGTRSRASARPRTRTAPAPALARQPAKRRPFAPQPIPAPRARRKAVRVVPPSTRPSTATPASADPQAPPDRTQAQST
jgi:hypothetical protein